MRVIGCLYYATTLPTHDKFAPRAMKYALLGYGIHQKGYKLYNLITKSCFFSRDMVFYKDKFPFNQKYPVIEDLSSFDPFPPVPISDDAATPLKHSPFIGPLRSPQKVTDSITTAFLDAGQQ